VEFQLIQVMNLKMQMIRFDLIVNVIQMILMKVIDKVIGNRRPQAGSMAA
jgi:hypothetical protein